MFFYGLTRAKCIPHSPLYQQKNVYTSNIMINVIHSHTCDKHIDFITIAKNKAGNAAYY